MITCRRRYFSGSACGSSRVLMIGRFSVVSRPTSTSKKSERWLSWKPCSRPSCPMPTRPAPHITRRLAGSAGRVEHDQLAGLVPPHDVERRGDLGGGVLRVRVVDVEPRAVGQ